MVEASARPWLTSPAKGSRNASALSFHPASTWGEEGWWKDKLDQNKRYGAVPRFSPVYVLCEKEAFTSELSALGVVISEAAEERCDASSQYTHSARSGSETSPYGWAPGRKVGACGSSSSLMKDSEYSRPTIAHTRPSTAHTRPSTAHTRPSTAQTRHSTARTRPSTAHTRASLNSIQPLSTTQKRPRTVQTRPFSAQTRRVFQPSQHTRSATRHLLDDAPARRRAACLSQRNTPTITPAMKKTLQELPDKNKSGYCRMNMCGHGS